MRLERWRGCVSGMGIERCAKETAGWGEDKMQVVWCIWTAWLNLFYGYPSFFYKKTGIYSIDVGFSSRTDTYNGQSCQYYIFSSRGGGKKNP